MKISELKEGDSIRWLNGLCIECSGTIVKNEEENELEIVVDKAEIIFPISLLTEGHFLKFNR